MIANNKKQVTYNNSNLKKLKNIYKNWQMFDTNHI